MYHVDDEKSFCIFPILTTTVIYMYHHAFFLSPPIDQVIPIYRHSLVAVFLIFYIQNPIGRVVNLELQSPGHNNTAI